MSPFRERNDRKPRPNQGRNAPAGPNADKPGRKERPRFHAKREDPDGWIWGRHAAEAAILNPLREAPQRAIASPAAARDLEAWLGKGRRNVRVEVLEPQEIARFLPQGAAHQGMALRLPGIVGPVAGRISGIAAALIAGALALGACTRQAQPDSYAPPPPPPPAPEQPPLAGPPSADTQARADAAVRQAQDDAWLANLPDGLIVTTRTDANGRTIYVISNRPIPNPAHAHAFRAHRAHLAGGPRTEVASAAPTAPAPQVAAQSVSPAPQPTPAPAAQTAPAPQAAPAAAPKPASTPATSAKPGFMGVTLPPILWVVLGLLLLIGVVFSILSGRRGKRRSREAHA